MVKKAKKRGFQLLSKSERVEIARMGGYARHAKKSKSKSQLKREAVTKKSKKGVK